MRPAQHPSKNVIALEPMKQLIKAIQIFYNIESCITYTDEAKLYIQSFLNHIISKHLSSIDLIIISNKRSTLFASDLILNESMFSNSMEITNNIPGEPYKLESDETVVADNTTNNNNNNNNNNINKPFKKIKNTVKRLKKHNIVVKNEAIWKKDDDNKDYGGE